jgi:hypothetical protein
MSAPCKSFLILRTLVQNGAFDGTVVADRPADEKKPSPVIKTGRWDAC